MEQWNDVSAIGVDSRDVWTLVVVAGEAGKRQVLEVVRAVVLARDDVVDLKLEQVVLLRDETVLAVVIGAPPYAADVRRVHPSIGC